MSDRAHGFVGAALLALAAVGLVWLLQGCAHAPPTPNLPDAGEPLPYPDAGTYDPCHDSSRPVGLLTPGERRTLCIKTVRPP